MPKIVIGSCDIPQSSNFKSPARNQIDMLATEEGFVDRVQFFVEGLGCHILLGPMSGELK